MVEHGTLRDANIRSTYDTMDFESSSALDAFYIPVLSVAKVYRRMSGFFSSTSLAVAAKGVASLIANGGRMELICGPVLSHDDVNVFDYVSRNNEALQHSYFEKNFTPSEDTIREDYVEALGWMLSNGLLRIKVAWVSRETDGSIVDESAGGIFHMKTGVVEDVFGNEIAFSGSNNETASGWVDNVEQFDVYKSWIQGQDSYLAACKRRFDDAWNNRSKKLIALDLPEALARGLEERGKTFDKDKFVAKHYTERQKAVRIEKKLSLYDYQKEAIKHWKAHGCQSLFEMATGTGKTRTAIACISEVQKTERKLVVVISSPQIHLSVQWMTNCKDMTLRPYTGIICDSTNPGWSSQVTRTLAGMRSGFSANDTAILFVTHDTVGSEKFTDVLKSSRLPILFIGDEVHGLGATSRSNAFIEAYRYRIGLSATPSRWFDEKGTRIIADYFGNNSYVLTIADALRYRCVCNYQYNPIFVDMSIDEMSDYSALTEKISKLRRVADTDPEVEEKLERLLQKRADIVKNAAQKMVLLRKYIQEHRQIEDTLVFCSPQQINQVQSMFIESNVMSAEYTYRQSALHKVGQKSERQTIVDRFVAHDISVIVAIKCLDEGIDIPSARTALLVSSSTNPREYIQRIGRVIRKSPGKTMANIYDFIVRPLSGDPESCNLYRNELRRAEYIAENSFEPARALDLLTKEIKRYGI